MLINVLDEHKDHYNLILSQSFDRQLIEAEHYIIHSCKGVLTAMSMHDGLDGVWV